MVAVSKPESRARKKRLINIKQNAATMPSFVAMRTNRRHEQLPAVTPLFKCANQLLPMPRVVLFLFSVRPAGSP